MKKGAHKLTKEDIKKIFNMYNSGLNHTKIAEEFISSRHQKVSRRHISSILQGKRWKSEINQVKQVWSGIN